MLLVGVILTSCDLELQESFDFVPEVDLTDPFADMTAWEYIQTRTTLNDEGKLSGEELNYMIAAIKKAGFEEYYNQTADTTRTYLLLNNNAFTGNGDIISMVTGSASVADGETPEQVMERVDTPEKLHILRKILSYHIVDEYVAQVPTLAETNVRYYFPTFLTIYDSSIPEEDGVISFYRRERWEMRVNYAPSILPSTATSGGWNEQVRNHNYVFNNGIGHYLNDAVRNRPY
ncbi:hypothetical protein [Aestuariivivens insulae]|uniref:hypothetical protein n=1 Tax=Aestuariivivens insulae TaxID=1621988 RepID=UPI001F560DFD|nr:hypothetical protein [Aestuariivivens insulae]